MAGSMPDLEVLMNKNRPYRHSPLYTVRQVPNEVPLVGSLTCLFNRYVKCALYAPVTVPGAGDANGKRQSLCPNGTPVLGGRRVSEQRDDMMPGGSKCHRGAKEAHKTNMGDEIGQG